MTTCGQRWAASSLALVSIGSVHIDDYVDEHGLVAMVRTTKTVKPAIAIRMTFVDV
jgi:hypothetical protein